MVFLLCLCQLKPAVVKSMVKYDDGSVRVVDPTLTLMCEYILQILLHCGRLRAVVSVRKYLVNAVAELRAREAAEAE